MKQLTILLFSFLTLISSAYTDINKDDNTKKEVQVEKVATKVAQQQETTKEEVVVVQQEVTPVVVQEKEEVKENVNICTDDADYAPVGTKIDNREYFATEREAIDAGRAWMTQMGGGYGFNWDESYNCAGEVSWYVVYSSAK